MKRDPRFPPSRIPLYAGLVLGGLLWCNAAPAQADFSEDFDSVTPTRPGDPGPAELLGRGWLFRNQSSPRGNSVYTAGPCSLCGGAHAGPRTLEVDFSSTTTESGGIVSHWAILPAIPGQVAGDILVFHARGVTTFNVPPRLEVRYSPGQGTGTGSSETDVGDFSALLIDLDPVPSAGWTRYGVSIPGDGRIAFRFFAPGVQPIIADGNHWLEIDTLSVGPPPIPPCRLPPLPAPGETVTWSAAGGPYVVCQDLTIPPGAAVLVEPGVEVHFEMGRQLVVAGTLRIDAAAYARAVFTASGSFPPSIVVQGGAIEARFAEFHQVLQVGSGATALLSDCAFPPGSAFLSDDIPRPPPFITLERCNFSGAQLTLAGCLVVVRDSTFTDTYASLIRSFPDITAVNTFTGNPLQIDRQESIQPLFIDGIHATESPTAGLSLRGGTYAIGSRVTLQGNHYPLELHGGLTPDSAVPVLGNTVDAIDVGNSGFAGRGRWPDLGLPYRLTGPTTSLPGGDLRIDPGVIVEGADPNAGLWFTSTRHGVLDGLPGAPITFRGLNGLTWGGLLFHVNSTTGCRLEHCIVEDAEVAVVSTDNLLYVDSCVFTRNEVGANMNTSGVILFRKTRFASNTVGLDFSDAGRPYLNGGGNPNAFEGNEVGIDAFGPSSASDARNCWWNDPSGPRAPGNPGGQGDVIGGIGAGGVQYRPFLTAAPDFANTPPVVRMIEPGLTQRYASPDHIVPDFLLDQGTRCILRWDVRSDDAIASQRIEFSPDGHYPDRFRVLVDGIPGDARSAEITVPAPGFASSFQPQFLRVIARDETGQEAWDQAAVQVPSGRIRGELMLATDLSGQTHFAGQAIPEVSWSGSVDFGLVTPIVVLESDGAAIAGLASSDGQGYFPELFPFVSTDRARLALQVTSNSNDVAWFFADGYFSIRHDPRMGFAPPVVHLEGPLGGESFPGGSTVSIAWTAEAPESLRSFDVQASYDAGRTWHPVALDLPAQSTRYDWGLPATRGIDDVRVRVIARDRRFQNSADDSGPFSIVPSSLFRRGDTDASGIIDITDAIFLLQHLFAGGQTPGCLESADAQNDGRIDITDAIVILTYLFLSGDPPASPGPPPMPCGPDPDAAGSSRNLGCLSYERC